MLLVRSWRLQRKAVLGLGRSHGRDSCHWWWFLTWISDHPFDGESHRLQHGPASAQESRNHNYAHVRGHINTCNSGANDDQARNKECLLMKIIACTCYLHFTVQHNIHYSFWIHLVHTVLTRIQTNTHRFIQYISEVLLQSLLPWNFFFYFFKIWQLTPESVREKQSEREYLFSRCVCIYLFRHQKIFYSLSQSLCPTVWWWSICICLSCTVHNSEKNIN